jgi:uncharacterized protein
VALCPSLDAERSLRYLTADPLGRQLEQAIAQELNRLARRLGQIHPQHFDGDAIARATSIWAFDRELVIPRLGFASVEAYYAASSPLPFMKELTIPTLILYAADDPLFDPALVPELQTIGAENAHIDLMLTTYGGHVGYFSSSAGQRLAQDEDPWWAWNRALDWVERSEGM